MLENFMIFSIFLTVLCTLVVLGLIVLASLYVLAEHIKDKRCERIQRKAAANNKFEKYLDEVAKLDVIFSDRRKEDTDDDY